VSVEERNSAGCRQGVSESSSSRACVCSCTDQGSCRKHKAFSPERTHILCHFRYHILCSSPIGCSCNRQVSRFGVDVASVAVLGCKVNCAHRRRRYLMCRPRFRLSDARRPLLRRGWYCGYESAHGQPSRQRQVFFFVVRPFYQISREECSIGANAISFKPAKS
jgi:hypothetical protein